MNLIPRDEFAKTSNLPVVLLHGTAMEPSSWTGLNEHIGPRLSVTAPDLSTYTSALRHAPSLDEIAEAVAEDILDPWQPVHLVGHDFGAVIAMKIAATLPGKVASLTLIEPTAFNALYPVDEAAWQIPRDVVATVKKMQALLDEGDAAGAMQSYVDLVNGSGAWERTTQSHRSFLAGRARQAMFDLRAIAADQMTPTDLAGIVCPVLLICGGRTLPILRKVASELHHSVPFVREEKIEGAGHFPHLTDPHLVDPMIVEFLVRVDGEWQDSVVTLRQAA